MKLKNINESSLFNDLRDPEFAAGYLEAIIQEGSLAAFLLAIKNVAEANGGLGELARLTERGRESMYKTLSEDGNPKFETLDSILKALGLRFSVTTADKHAA